MRQLTKAGCAKVFCETASGAKTDRGQLRRVLDQLDAGDVLMVTRFHRLAGSTRDLMNTLATITDRKAGFRSPGDAWADTTTSHGRLMVTVLGAVMKLKNFACPSLRATYLEKARGILFISVLNTKTSQGATETWA